MPILGGELRGRRCGPAPQLPAARPQTGPPVVLRPSRPHHDGGSLCGPSEPIEASLSVKCHIRLGFNGTGDYMLTKYLLSLIWNKFLRHLLLLYFLFSELLTFGPCNDLVSRGISSPQLASLLPG